MVIVSSVTPWSVAPAASPSPHGDSRSPNAAAVASADSLPAASWLASSPSRSAPHAPAVSARARAAMPMRAPRTVLRFLIWIDLLLTVRRPAAVADVIGMPSAFPAGAGPGPAYGAWV